MSQFFQIQDIGAITPELELVAFGMFLLIFDLLIPEKRKLGLIALVGIAISGLFLFRLRNTDFSAYGGVLVLDPFSIFFKFIFLIAAALSIAISLLYGLSGSTRFVDIAEALSRRPLTDPISMMAMITLSAGMFFKVAAVPFHQWTPDAYEGAPTSITAFMSVAVKAASFAMMVRIFMVAIYPLRPQWLPIMAAVSVMTMTIGNIAAITQSNVKRMLAYSSISHAGYILIGFIAGNETGLTAVPLYLFIYTFTNLGAWAVVVALRRKDVIGEQIDDMAGLFFRHPSGAVLMLIFLLSLAGIPPTAGFIGKYYLFAAAIQTGHNTLAVIAVLNAAISIYFYFRIVVSMFMREAMEKTGVAYAPGLTMTLAIATFFTLLIGVYPDPFIAMARQAVVLGF